MAKSFKNVVTGNILTPKNEEAEKLMANSDRYVEVVAAKKSRGKRGANDASEPEAESAGETAE